MKRLLGFILALVMVFSLFPAALAAEAEEPAEEILAEDIPVEEPPVEEVPAEEVPVEEVPVEEAPAEDVPVEEAPVEEAPAEDVPTEETPVEEVPAEETPVEEVPAEEELPAEDAEDPTEEAPAEDNPAEEPTEESPLVEITPEEPDRLGPVPDEPTAAGTAINSTNFPNDTFRAWVSANADTDGNGILSTGEANSVSSIVLNNQMIDNLTGLRYFPSLTSLYCIGNWLTKLDLSGNPALVQLQCDKNQLTTLDVSGNPALKSLLCSGNQLTTLNVSRNPVLESLDCSSNQLKTLVVSSPALTTLVCKGNDLKTLSVSNVPALTLLDCSYNQLTTLDVSSNPELHNLNCAGNQLKALDLSGNTELTALYCGDNQLTALNVRPCPQLWALYCGTNQLTTLDVSGNPNLSILHCKDNRLTKLDLSGNTALAEARVSEQTTQAILGSSGSGYSLDFAALVGSGNVGRVTITDPESGYTYNNGVFTTTQALTSLTYTYDHGSAASDPMDVTATLTVIPSQLIKSITNTDGGIVLSWTAVSAAAKYAVYRKAAGESGYSRLTAVSGTSYTDPTVVDKIYYYYRIWCLDASGKTLGEMSSARGITCSRNMTPAITSIANTESGVKLTWDAVPGAAKYAIYRQPKGLSYYSRYSITSAVSYTDRNVTNGSIYSYRVWCMDSSGNLVGDGSSPASITAAIGTPISAAIFPDDAFLAWVLEKVDTDKDGLLTKKEANKVTRIAVSGKGISDLTGLQLFPALEELDCHSNSLTTLDLSGNPVLTQLSCGGNQLMTLDLSGNPALTQLNCGANQLMTLDLSGNPALNVLYCGGNQLKALDLTGNPVLEDLYCAGNQLTSINLRGCTALWNLRCDNNQLTALDLTGNPALELVRCANNQLTELDVSANLNLVDMDCSYNRLTALNIGANSSLINLWCNNNQLKELDVSGCNLSWFFCSDNLLTNLDVRGCSKLAWFECQNNQLTALDVSANPKLDTLKCTNNHLPSLDLRTDTFCSFADDPVCLQTAQAVMTGSGSSFTLDFAPLVGAGNVEKVTIQQPTGGYTYKNGKLTCSTVLSSVVYEYDCGNDQVMEVTLTVTAAAAPQAPVISSIANTPGGVKLTWGAVPGAAKYAVYRKAQGESKYTRYTITTATSYTDKNAVNGTFYYYRIWSMDASGKTMGEWSNARGITCSRSVTPSIASIANISAGVKVTWNPVPGVAKYAIYRKAAGESKYTRISVKTTTSYVDQSAQSGTYYYYRIWSMDANGKTIGTWSNARAITRTAS